MGYILTCEYEATGRSPDTHEEVIMAKKQNLTLTRELTAEDKLAPQSRVILSTILEAAGVGTAIDRDDVVAKLTESGALNTRQDPSRVVAYYMPRLKEAGLLDIEDVASEPSADGEAKPKRTRKAKAEATEGPTEVGAVAPSAPAEEAVEGEVAV